MVIVISLPNSSCCPLTSYRSLSYNTMLPGWEGKGRHVAFLRHKTLAQLSKLALTQRLWPPVGERWKENANCLFCDSSEQMPDLATAACWVIIGASFPHSESEANYALLDPQPQMERNSNILMDQIWDGYTTLITFTFILLSALTALSLHFIR